MTEKGVNNLSQINILNFEGYVSSLKKMGTEYIILGHSENRKIGDTDKVINTKIRSALKANLKIIFCIGETLK